jgi:hypothetical protein
MMKKVIFFILLISPCILHAQLFVNLGAGAATFEQKIPVSNEGAHVLPSQLLVPVVKMAAGYQIRHIVMEAELRPTLTRQSNSPNNFGLKAGYCIHHFVPAIGYYYNYCNSDNPANNTSGFGYSLEYLLPVTRNGDLYLEAAYMNHSMQLTGGFHIPF